MVEHSRAIKYKMVEQSRAIKYKMTGQSRALKTKWRKITILLLEKISVKDGLNE